ncbi:MAG: redoxin family protein [Rhizobiales bacterium]|nr:redoxin family protein [Hyphomicrobiales bacterium]
MTTESTMPLPVKLDHCVIHVFDWERSNAFYRDVMGAELVQRPVGWAYRFGDRQLNVHGPGVAPAEVARLPVQPGNSDFCFEWSGPIADAIAHLQRNGVTIERGPLERFGARGAGISVYFRDPDGSLMEFMSYDSRSRETTSPRNLNVLPDTLPIPHDDGGARHLAGLRLPALALHATDGTQVDLSRLSGRTVVYIYPRTGVPGQASPDGWDAIPGARGCTPQSCSFRDHFAELKQLGVAQVFGLSAQDIDEQRETAERLHLPFPVLSDAGLRLARAIDLPTFAVTGMTLLKRMVLVIDDSVVTKVFYPVFPPDKSAEEVIDWLKAG